MWSKKKNKYGVAAKAERTYNGKVYDSKKEMTFRKKLDLLKSAKDPSERVITIEEHKVYPLDVNGVHICDYELDFKVWYEDGSIKHFDVKGMTVGGAYQLFKAKKRLMLACYQIHVIEV